MVNMSDTEWSPSMEDDRKSRRTSSVWRYCEIIDDTFARCTICEHKLSYKSSVTNLRKHFKKKHPDVTMEPGEVRIQRFLRNGTTRNDSEDRTETQRATNTVIVDYLRPAGEENRPRHMMSNVKSSAKYGMSLKRERSPERHEFRMGSKYSHHQEIEENEFDLFGRSVTMQLKQLPLVHALELQAEITNVIIQKRIQALRHSHETNTEEAPMQYALVYATTEAETQNTEEVASSESKESSTQETVITS